MELNGEVKGWRLTDQGPETLGAESVIGFFKAKSLSKMINRAELERAEIAGFVEVGVRGHLVSTDYAEYERKADVVSSERPVRVEGKNRVFTGDDGFVYDIEARD